jgi:hypothetical protein
MLHLQKIVGRFLNVLPDVVTVRRPIPERAQDQHVKRSLEEPGPLLCLFCHGRHPTLNLATMVDTRLSIVKGLIKELRIDAVGILQALNLTVEFEPAAELVARNESASTASS